MFYIFTSRFKKAEEVLNILAEKYNHFVSDVKFFIDMARVALHIFSGDGLLRNDQAFEGIKNEIRTLTLPPPCSESMKTFFQTFQKACNESKFWNDLLEKLFDTIISQFPHRNPLFAYIYQLKSKLEENLGNHEEARECLFKSLEILRKFVSPKNIQVIKTEEKIVEIEKEIKPRHNKQICF
ncbi:unnamed protein product [Blepharisma stoltei]|uniref:Uncharacterized protein n=1 Tax=Blepharisma stoltei TaxID=1481888 RepID=A0AAU9JRA4_9CILI|nr:unnamed protein product [Blepharisma stoltei]